MVSAQYLPVPDLYQKAHAFDSEYRPSIPAVQQAAYEYRDRYDLKPVGGDRVKVHVLAIDNQYDFTFPSGSLFVGGRSGQGAMEDQDRVVRFLYENQHRISQITTTMDSHLKDQVFFNTAHLRRDGSVPDPFTVITAEEYHRGDYRPNPVMANYGYDLVWLQRQFAFYCDQLERAGKYQLILWPHHTMLGSHGHQLAGVVDELRYFHGFARSAVNAPAIKGNSPLSEHYSVIKAEVLVTWDGKPIPGTQKNARLLEALMNADVVIAFGQAASHCFAWTIDDLLNEIAAKDPNLAKKIYLVKDATSAVVVPGVSDYTPESEAAFARFQNAGMNVVSTTDDFMTWPGIEEKYAVAV